MAEEILQLDQEAGQIEQATAGLEVDEKVDVAGGMASPRATDPNTRTLVAP